MNKLSKNKKIISLAERFAFCLVCNHLYCSKTSLDKTDSISSDLVFFLFDLNALLSYRLVQPRNPVHELTILNVQLPFDSGPSVSRYGSLISPVH